MVVVVVVVVGVVVTFLAKWSPTPNTKITYDNDNFRILLNTTFTLTTTHSSPYYHPININTTNNGLFRPQAHRAGAISVAALPNGELAIVDYQFGCATVIHELQTSEFPFQPTRNRQTGRNEQKF